MDRIYVPSRPYCLDTDAVLELCRLRLELLISISDESLRKRVINSLIQLAEEVNISVDTVLDFGTGSGELVNMLCDRWRESRICGVDMCMDSLIAGHIRNLILIQSSGPLPFRTDAFSIVTSLFVFHFKLPYSVRADLLRILKPGGHLIGNVYGHDTPHMNAKYALPDGSYASQRTFLDYQGIESTRGM